MLFEGPPDPSKTIFVRHSSTVVCTADIPHVLSIEPRDEFNNICMFQPGDNPTSGYTVDISEVCPRLCLYFYFVSICALQIGCRRNLSDMARLDYDAACQRICLQVLFPSEGCYHASVAYNGVVLNNGDFDIIVLSSK